MTNAEETAIITADKAHDNYEKTVRTRAGLEGGFIVLGMLLKESQEDSLYKFLGYDSFNEYLGAPELGFKRSTAYKLIGLISLFVDKLKIPETRLIGVGSTKLGAIAKVVENDVEGWLSKAEHLSKSSLDEEINGVSGRETISPPSKSPAPPSPMTCINGCGPGEKSHFPVTRGAGGKEVEDWWVPMCRKCHDDFHYNAKDFTWLYKRAWAKYLYGLINRGE
jgi:hypothetical protein